MSRIAACTSCQQQVTIPKGVAPGESVRCPHCEAEYALIAVLLEAVEADGAAETPPELVPVVGEAEPDETGEPSDGAEEAPGDEEPEQDVLVGEVDGAEQEFQPPGDEAAQTMEQSEEAVEKVEGEEESEEAAEGAEEEEEGEEAAVASEEPADEEPPAEKAAGAEEEPAEEQSVAEPPAPEAPADQETGFAVRCPHCEAEYPLNEVIVVSTGDALGPGAAAAAARVALGGEEAGSALAGLDVWAKVDAMPQIDLGEGAGPHAVTADAVAFDFAKEDAEAEPGAEEKPRPKRRRKQKSGFRALIGPVLGGLGGLLIAYYLLNWIRPETGNFLQIPLPGIPHTYKYSPDWFPGFLKLAPESEDALVGALPDELAGFEEPEAAAPAPGEEQATSPPEKREPPNETQAGAGVGSVVEEPKPSQRKTLPEGYVGLIEPPSYSSEELGEALMAAVEGLEDPAAEISEEAFRTMCRLAEMITFVDSSSGARAAGSRRSAARKLLQQIGANPTNLDKVGFQAGALCVRQDRQANGILLAGKVAKLVSEGNAHGAHVELAASGKAVLVVGKQPLPAKVDDSVLILGSIVDNPAENLAGFPTQQPFAIWAGLTVKIQE